MKLIVDIREKDIEDLKNKVMTIEDMDNTLEGRVICAIVHAALYTPYREADEPQESEAKKEFEEEALAEFLYRTGIPKEKVDQYSRVNRIEFHDCGVTYELKNPGLAVIFNSRSSDGVLPILYFPKNHQDISEPVLSHSEITGLIYVYFGGEKYEITKAAIEAVEAIKALEQKPTNKTCRTCGNFGSHHGICEICKDNKCWTEKEPTNKNDCGEQMDFPDTFDEFAKVYGFKDKDEVYTNGSELIPVFRVKQWLEHISSVTSQESVLNKIRSEIIDTGAYEQEVHGKTDFLDGINYCLSVIDKHMAESEES